MKVTYSEGEFGANIELEPETIEESSALARMTLNAKSIKPEIRHYFSGKGQSCSVWIRSVAKSVRRTSIKNGKP